MCLSASRDFPVLKQTIYLNSITKLVVVSEVRFANFEFFHGGSFGFGELTCDAAALFEGFPTFRRDLLPLPVLKGQVDRYFCNVGTEFFV